nr:odorant binding protein 22 [Pagiophloeus tsushimanus]
MKSVLVVFISCYVVYIEALDCGISRISGDEFKKVITECVKDNQTLNSIWDLALSISAEDNDSSESSSDEEVPIRKGLSNMNTKNVKLASSGRTKRSRNTKGFNNDSPMSNKKYSSTTEETTTIQDERYEEKTSSNHVDQSDDACIIQCIFEKLEMADSSGLPDHKKFADELLKTASGREVRDFLQESTDECFQQIEQEDSQNPCEYSSKLVTCLAQKGKSNCDDWPTGNLPL